MSRTVTAYRRNRYTASSASDSDDEESDHQPRGVVARREFLLENGTLVAERRPSRGGSFSPRRNSSSKRSNPPQIDSFREDAPPIRGSPSRRPPSPQKVRPASRGLTSPTKSSSFKREIAASRKPSYRGDLPMYYAELSRAQTSPVRVQSPIWYSAPKGGFITDFSSRGQSGFETNDDELPVLIHNVSLRVKQQIQTTLSDPLKRRAAGSLRRARDRAAVPVASVRQKVHEISNRLTMPKFFSDERSSSDID
uniref:Uncharacterized protein n=1 Tax=Parascaris univalens TaxID=6257 RepID=A0A915AKY5_PARUN